MSKSFGPKIYLVKGNFESKKGSVYNFKVPGEMNLKTRPSLDSEAATMYKLKGQSSNMQTGQSFKYCTYCKLHWG